MLSQVEGMPHDPSQITAFSAGAVGSCRCKQNQPPVSHPSKPRDTAVTKQNKTVFVGPWEGHWRPAKIRHAAMGSFEDYEAWTRFNSERKLGKLASGRVS